MSLTFSYCPADLLHALLSTEELSRGSRISSTGPPLLSNIWNIRLSFPKHGNHVLEVVGHHKASLRSVGHIEPLLASIYQRFRKKKASDIPWFVSHLSQIHFRNYFFLAIRTVPNKPGLVILEFKDLYESMSKRALKWISQSDFDI